MDDIPRYRKKSHKKPPKKSNHKHEFVPCVFIEKYHKYYYVSPSPQHEQRDVYTIGRYCHICGKVGYTGDLEEDGWTVNTAQRPWICHEWSDKAKREFDPKTRTLPCFEITDMFQKFVDMNERSALENG